MGSHLNSHHRLSWPHLVAAFGLMIAELTGCVPPDYRTTKAVIVDKQSFSLLLHLPSDGESLSHIDMERLAAFVDNYLVRGEGQLEIAMSEGKSFSKQSLMIADRLKILGLHADEITVQTIPAQKRESKAEVETSGTAILNYRGYIAQVPQCGDWSQPSTFSISNGTSENYGCATQRNIGLMVRNPRDLVRSRDAQARSGGRAKTIVDAYGLGDDKGNKANTSSAVSTVAK